MLCRKEGHRRGTRGVEKRREEIESSTFFFFGGHRRFYRPRRKKLTPSLSLSLSLSPPFKQKQEPIITWSFIIGGIGLAIPLVVPPMRDALTPASRKQPPPVAQLLGREEGAAAATQKQ